MIDVIKFSTTKARMHPFAIAIAAAHPLYQRRSVHHSREHKSMLATVNFGHAKRLVTVKFLIEKGIATRLIGVDANLPAILFGHNGRLLRTQGEMLKALTILRFLIAPLAHPDDIDLILPSREADNSSYIKSVECAVQLQDPGSGYLLAAPLTGCRNFPKTSQIYPGESVLHRSSGMDLAIYDKFAEAKEGGCVPEDIPCTRVEVRFKKPRRLLEALNFSKPKTWLPAALSFDTLFSAFRHVIERSLVGALADPPESEPKRLKPATRLILELAGDCVSLLAALAEQSKLKTPEEYGKVRREILAELARLSPLSLPALTKEFPVDCLSEIVNPELEAMHEGIMTELCWPAEPDADIAETFSGLLVHKSAKPGEKVLLRHSEL